MVSVCVCFVYKCVCMHVCVIVHACVCTPVCTHMYLYVCMCLCCMCVHARECVQAESGGTWEDLSQSRQQHSDLISACPAWQGTWAPWSLV